MTNKIIAKTRRNFKLIPEFKKLQRQAIGQLAEMGLGYKTIRSFLQKYLKIHLTPNAIKYNIKQWRKSLEILTPILIILTAYLWLVIGG